MRKLVFEGILAIATLAILTIGASADECRVNSEHIWFTTGYDEKDVDLCRLNWAVEMVGCNPAPAGSGNEATYTAYVGLVGEDDDRIQSLTTHPAGEAQIWWRGDWFTRGEFIKKVLTGGCR